jgi:hypothetical protein
MRIRIVIDPARARIWHRRLATDLRSRGHGVSIVIRPGRTSAPAAVLLLLALERRVYRQSASAPGSQWKYADLAAAARETMDEPPELVVDLTGAPDANGGVRALRPVYAQALVEEAVVSALLAGQIPLIGVVDSKAPDRPQVFRAAVERPRVLCKSLNNLGARLATILAGAVERVGRDEIVVGIAGVTLHDATQWPQIGAFDFVVARARAALTSLSAGQPHWFVGWRPADRDRLSETMRLPQGGWRRLPDDGARFYADPFVFQYNGRLWLFVEEFPFATKKAMVSVVEMGPDGPQGTPRPVLERTSHLSYPFVFAHDGAVWMIPENSAAGRVELFRASNFPYEWESAGVLIDGLEVSDATIVQHAGALWMFGTVGGGGESSWDALHLWHASELTGPWRPHAGNPVLIDSCGARPAGAHYLRAGHLWRPAQDCTSGYGVGLALARITKLDTEGFAQTIEAVIRPGDAWPGIGIHTLNWAAGIEVVDGCTNRRA